ncbi:MAG: T9SS type A sorting domain-containing protein [Chitinophagaceae bacterium]
MKHLFTQCVLLLLIVSTPKIASSQLPPLYKFTSNTLDSGSSNSVGAVYRFHSVFTNVDALVKVTDISAGMTLRDIDRTADGYNEAFQPEYKISGLTTGYIDFKITFVTAGTSTITSQAAVAATGLDIDGSSNAGLLLKEFNRIDMGGGTYEYNSYSSQLIISQTGTAFTSNNLTGILFGALVDTSAKEVMYTVTSSNVSSMNFRVGAVNQMAGNSTRYASLYYNNFTYQHYPLSISNLVSFTGSAGNNKVDLKWSLTAIKPASMTLERSTNSSDFYTVSEYNQDAADGNTREYQYTDNNVFSDVVYYRLKSTNLAGHVEYSSILSFRMGKNTKKELTVYPSVIQTSATVNINAAERESALLLVTDISGRTVKQQQVALNSGTNSISVNGFERFLKGHYIISVRTASGIYSRPVIIQ